MKKVGILGFAHGHVFAYGGQWLEHPEYGVVMTAAWDHNAARLKESAEKLGISALCDTPEALLAQDIDAVVISCETAFHCELVEKTAAAGKAIICYKPLCLTLEEADRMVAAVEKYQVPFTLGYQSRTDPQNGKIRELIQSDALGKVFLYRRRHCLSTHMWGGFENTWHNDPKLNRDIFADDSSHPFDLVNWTFGLPESVMCEMSTVRDPSVQNDTDVALFRYPNGMLAEVTLQFTCTAAEITTEVYGEKGAVTQSFGDAVSTQLPHSKKGLKYYFRGDADWTDSDIPSPEKHGARIAGQAKPFADFLSGKRGPVCSVQEGRDCLRMVLACYVSSREGRRVRLDDPALYTV